jgi:hypothetical protein
VNWRSLFRKDDDELVWGVNRQAAKDLLWVIPLGLGVLYFFGPYIMILSIPVMHFLGQLARKARVATITAMVLAMSFAQPALAAVRGWTPSTLEPSYIEVTICPTDATSQEECDEFVAFLKCGGCLGLGYLCWGELVALKAGRVCRGQAVGESPRHLYGRLASLRFLRQQRVC